MLYGWFSFLKGWFVMSNNGFPSVNGGFPQAPQQGFPQAQAQAQAWGQGGSSQQGAHASYGFAQRSKGAEQPSGSAPQGAQQGAPQGAPQGADTSWGAWGNNPQETRRVTPQGTQQGIQGFGANTKAPTPTQAGYYSQGQSARNQNQSAFPQDDQATTVLPPMNQMVDSTNQGYWAGQQNQPATYQADVPVKPKEGILYKNTGRKLEEIPDPTPVILETTGGKMMLTLDTVSIYRLGDAAKRHRNYYVELPLKSLSSASVVSDTDKDGNVISAVCLDVVTVEGHNQVPATAADALKDVWSFEVSNIDEAQGFCDKVNARINNERFPVRDMPHIDEGPRNTVIAGVIAGILAVVLLVVCFTGHPYSKQSYKLSPAEISRIHEDAMNKAQKEAEEKVAADQAKKQEEQAKKDQENQRKQAEQQSQQQNAERDAAKQTAQRILATDILSKQGLVNKMVARGITQDLAQSTADGLPNVDWSANATNLAKKYLQAHPDWTSGQLSAQLVSNDLFTQEEANAATSALAGEIGRKSSQNGSFSQSGNEDSGKDKGKSGILDGITNWLGGSDNK